MQTSNDFLTMIKDEALFHEIQQLRIDWWNQLVDEMFLMTFFSRADFANMFMKAWNRVRLLKDVMVHGSLER
jgi:hypothetical protein